jgi:hypothetical protein
MGTKVKKAKGNPERTRVLFVEPPAKRYGSPFIAVRVPRELLAAFRREAKSRKLTPPEYMRTLMCKATGVELGGDDE